jgi:DNA polymerase-3 subunit delta
MPGEPHLFFLYGNDDFAIANRLKEFQQSFSDANSALMNIARLDGHALNEDEFNTAVNAVPFLAHQRLVLLADPSAHYTTPAARKKFFEFLENVPTSTQLVLSEQIENRKADEQRHWLLNWVRKSPGGSPGKLFVKIERFMMPRAWQMPDWIVGEAKRQGGEIDSQAAAHLTEMVGENTRQAAQEITKLLTYVNFARPISLRDVEAVSVTTAQQSVFDFVDALAEGDGGKTTRLLHSLLDESDPFSLWGMVIRQFRLLILARELIDAGGNQKNAEKALGVHTYVAEKAFKQAHRFAMPALESIYHRLLEIDEGVKTSQITLDLALEMLVMELARPAH